ARNAGRERSLVVVERARALRVEGVDLTVAVVVDAVRAGGGAADAAGSGERVAIAARGRAVASPRRQRAGYGARLAAARSAGSLAAGASRELVTEVRGGGIAG